MGNKVIQVVRLHVPEVDQLVYTKQDSDPISSPVNEVANFLANLFEQDTRKDQLMHTIWL